MKTTEKQLQICSEPLELWSDAGENGWWCVLTAASCPRGDSQQHWGRVLDNDQWITDVTLCTRKKNKETKR